LKLEMTGRTVKRWPDIRFVLTSNRLTSLSLVNKGDGLVMDLSASGFRAFVNQSKCNLTRLQLYVIKVDPDSFLEMLQLLPSLLSLTIDDALYDKSTVIKESHFPTVMR
jgi:hypothetical protein